MNKILLLCLVVLLGCEENKVSQYQYPSTHDGVTTTIENSYLDRPISRRKELFNGYKHYEWVSAWGNDHKANYRKIVFKEIRYGHIKYYVTKYAYSTHFVPNHSQFRLNIMFRPSHHKCEIAIRRWKRPFNNSCKESWLKRKLSNWYNISDVEGMFTKKEYTQWMEQHPETIILEA